MKKWLTEKFEPIGVQKFALIIWLHLLAKCPVMLTSIKGYYEKGKVVLSEQPPVLDKTEVIITFLTEKHLSTVEPKRVLGTLANRIKTPDDFNEPLNAMKEYI